MKLKRGRKLQWLRVEICRNYENNGYEVYVQGNRMFTDTRILSALKIDDDRNYLAEYLPLPDPIETEANTVYKK